MLKRVLIIASIICVSGIVLLMFFFLKKQHTKQDFDPVNVVPINTFCILSINNLDHFTNETIQENQIWRGLHALPPISDVQEDLEAIDSMVKDGQKSLGFFVKQACIISLHFTENRDFDYLFATNLESETNAEACVELVKQKVSNRGQVTSFKYDNTSVYEVSLPGNTRLPKFYFAIVNNVFVASKVKVLVQASIGQVNASESLLKNNDFRLVHNSADHDKDANLYVNYREVPKFLSLYASKENYRTISQATRLASWEELDLTIKEKNLLLNGIVTTDTMASNYFSIFAGQEATSLNIQSVIPASSAGIVSVSVSDPAKFKSSYENYLKKNGDFGRHRQAIADFDSLCNGDIEDVFYSIIEGEMCAVLPNDDPVSGNEQTYAVFGTKSRGIAEEKLFGLLDSYASKNNLAFESFRSEFKVDADAVFKIYRMPAMGVPSMLFGDIFAYTDANFFTFVDNYLVFGNSVTSLSEFIKSFVRNKTLLNDTRFKSVEGTLVDSYNLLVYTDIPASLPFIKTLLGAEYKTHLENYIDVYGKFQSAAYQLSQSNGKLYNTIYMTYSPVSETRAQTVWESHLDSLASMKPTLMTNSQTNEKEIFVQDMKNTIYLINKAGRILWKQNVKEKINSEIFQVDYFRNGKKQFVFSTLNYIYIVDRIGNFVEHYPIQLKARASAGIAVFDYEKNRNYRMAIPCVDKSIYLYDIEGKVLKDWKFDKAEEPITQPLQHFKMGGDKDYLVCNDKYNIYILSRKGERKITVKERFELSGNNQVCIDKADPGKARAFLATDKKGNLKRIDLQGNVITREFDDISPDHFFTVKDLNNDGANELIYLNESNLTVYDQNTEKMFTFNFSSKTTSQPLFFEFSSTDTKIGILNANEGRIYLINRDGKLYEGFPLQGTTPFSIGYLNRGNKNFNLIVGGNENYIYNYEIR